MLTIPKTDSQGLISLILNKLYPLSLAFRNTVTQLMLLTCLTMVSSLVSAWIPPKVTITDPTTSNYTYVTEDDTIDIAGRAEEIGLIDQVNWILFDLDAWEEIDSGEATIENNVPFSATWFAKDIKIPEGMSDITVIAFNMHGDSDYDRLTIIRSSAPLEEVFDEDIAQSDPKDSCGRQTGDPIDTATGAQFLEQTLLTVQGVMPISFALEYNSLLTKKGTTGRGWGNNNFSTRLEELDNGDIKIHWTTNRYNLFIKQANDQYESSHSACRFDQLVKNAEGHFTLSRKDKTIYQFNAQGELVQMSHQNGQSLSFSYNGDGRLARITEPVSGVFLDYAYNNEGLLETVTDPLGRQAKLEYDSDHNLTKMTDAASQTTTYTYNKFGQTLTAVNADGVQLFSNTYDDKRRIITQDDSISSNQLIRLSYDEESQPGKRITTVTNRVGDTKVYTFDDNNHLLSLKDELGHTVVYTYDANGKRTSVTDANDQTTYFEYDTNGNLKTLINAANHQTQLTYDDDSHLLSVENALGKQIHFAYENNHLTSITDPFNHITRYTYNNYGQVLTKTSQRKAITTYEYENGRLVRTIDPEGVIYTLSYDAAGRLTTLTDVDDNTTRLAYDDIDRLIKVTNPLGHEVSMTYDSRNNLLTFTDANGNVTRRRYDGNGNLISQINALNQETHYEYDGEGRLIRVIDALAHVTELSYDVKGRLISVTNPLGETQTLEYDAADNLLKRFDAFGKRVMSFNYDPLNNPISVTDALNQSSTFEYDELNRLIRTTDPLNRKTQFGYDDLNRLVSSVDALMGESSQSFDADGNKETLVDPNNNKTQFAFDNSGRLVQETLATGDKVKYTYKTKDLLESVTNGRNQQRHFEYDAINRLTRWTDPDGFASYTYDKNGNVLTVTDADGTITREYDVLNRVTKYTDTRGNILQYVYDKVGHLGTLIYPDGKQVHYEYDVADRLVKVTDWANRVTRYAYDKNSSLISILRPNGTQMTRAYDEAGQLLQQKDMLIEKVISQFDFRYDAVGNIISETAVPEIEPDFNLEMTYAAANRLATYNGSTVEFDADGNMTKGPLSSGMADFMFDSRNRLIQAGDTVYRYDAENQRIGMNQTQYVVNSQPALSQVLVKEENGQKTFYVYGLGLIGQESNGEYLTYHFDFRGSTVALTDKNGQAVERFQYSPYGLRISGDAAKTPFLFNGMYGVMSDSNGLYYMRARFYSPEIRRFINQDILLGRAAEGQTLNRYAYVTGRPVIFVDPFGLLPLSLERAVEIVKLFLPHLYNNYASPVWGNLLGKGRTRRGGETNLETGKITIDESFNLFDNFPIRKEIELCGKLTPEKENIFRRPAIQLLELVIHEFMHSTLDKGFKEKHWLGSSYLFYDNFFYEIGINGTWHSKIYQRSQEFAQILVRLMFFSDEEFSLLKK